MAEEFNLSIYNDVYDMSFNQETEEIHIELKEGYYPLSNNVDLSNYYNKSESDLRYKSINYVPNWSELFGKPTTFTPSAHTHTISEVINLQSTLDNKEDKLNAVNLGEILDTQLSIKMTPSADDEIVILDSITGDAATVKFSSFGGNVDTSNLVPYTGANKDVNIGANYFKTSKGFDFTYDNDNYFRAIKRDNYYYILDFKSKDESDDNFGSIELIATPEIGFIIAKKDNNGLLLNNLQVYKLGTYSIKPFVSDEGFIKTGGTSSQYLMADGSTSTLPTDLIKGTGAINYLTKITSSGTIGNSIVYENNNSVSIGDTVSDARLRVKAQGSNATDIVFRIRNSEDTRNFLVVNGAGDVYSNGGSGVSTNTFFGELIARNTVGTENASFAQASLLALVNGNQNSAFGRTALTNINNSSQNAAFAAFAGRFIADGTTPLTSANLGVFIGFNTKASANGNINEIVIGANATGNGSNTATIGNDSTTSVYLKGITNSNGFKTPTGTANQGLRADGGVFDLNTKADLDGGKVPAWQLPSYVDDVLEYANLANFPATGESGKIYIAIDTNLTYRWGGSSYVVMSSSLALGETSSTAYRGDNGKTAYEHSQKTTGNPHNTKVEELSDIGNETTSIVDTDTILKKEVGGIWRKITFANFKNWFTTELAKKINIGLDTVFNLKNISAMTLTQFKALTPNIETIYFTEEQNATGWQQIKYNGLGISIPATTETKVSITDENYIELDSDSTFNLIDVANTKINGIFEKDFVIIKFNAGVVTPATANQWFKVILKVNNVQTAVSPVFYLTETSGTVEQIAHNFSLNVPAEMVTNGATLHLKTSTNLTFNNPAISVARVHKSTNANL